MAKIVRLRALTCVPFQVIGRRRCRDDYADSQVRVWQANAKVFSHHLDTARQPLPANSDFTVTELKRSILFLRASLFNHCSNHIKKVETNNKTRH